MANPIDISKHFPDEQPSNPFAASIQMACAQHGISAAQLAALINYSEQDVLKVYNGEALASKCMLIRMCTVLQMDLQDMMFLSMLAKKQWPASVPYLKIKGNETELEIGTAMVTYVRAETGFKKTPIN